MFSLRLADSLVILALLFCPSARSLCVYKDEMNAKTTIREEFRDSKWVIRARVLAVNSQWENYTTDVPWTIYSLAVVQSFKGQAPRHLTMFTFRDSGPSSDIGGEYLLFLDPVANEPDLPREAHQSTEVNYSCGQSKPWRNISPSEKQKLSKLTRLQ
jgi:hypothetical protein